MSVGWTEILLILLVAVLIFGSKRIPEIARALGRASYEFKKAKDEVEKETKDLVDAAEQKARVEDEAKKEQT